MNANLPSQTTNKQLKMNLMLKLVATALPLCLLVFSFQNCAKSGLAAVGPESKVELSSTLSQDPQVMNATGGGSSSFKMSDSSVGDGTSITRMNQRIVGAGPGLRACTGPIGNRMTACLQDSDFVLLTGAWGANSYNVAEDVYATEEDVSRFGYPFQQYFTRYILSNGTRHEVTFTPSRLPTSSSTSGGLKWVYTNPQTCVGPTPAPAEIGAACSVAGQTATNACGTATCK